MKFIRFAFNSEILKGVLIDDKVKHITGNIFGEWRYTGKEFAVNEVKLQSPIVPNQIIGIGANYVSTVENLPSEIPKIPVFFFKPTSSVAGPGENIILPDGADNVKFESELAVIIGKEGRHILETEVLDFIFGYTVANDVTAPQFFHQDGHWTIGKSFDTFTPLGPVIETELNLGEVRVEAKLNGIEKQNSPLDLMIVSISKMISFLSSVMTLKPGDVILTGSPVGAEFIGEGDVIECEIKGIGTLRNQIISVKQIAENA